MQMRRQEGKTVSHSKDLTKRKVFLIDSDSREQQVLHIKCSITRLQCCNTMYTNICLYMRTNKL